MKFKIKPWHSNEYPTRSDNDYETLPYIDQSVDDNVANDMIRKLLFNNFRPDRVIGAAIDQERKQATVDPSYIIECISNAKHVVTGVLRGVLDIVQDFVTTFVQIVFPCFVVAAIVLGPYCYADLSALG